MTFHLSTSNFKLSRNTIREISIIFIILIVVEIGVRALVTSGWIPVPFGLWNRGDYPIVLFESEQLDPELFFIGNSITKHGVNTNLFNSYYVQMTNRNIRSFNAGISGTPAYITTTFASEFLIPDYNAKTIIWVLRASDLDGYVRERWYQQWLDFLDVPEVKARLQSQFSIDDMTQNWWTWRFRHTLKYVLTHMSRPFAYSSDRRENYGYVPLVKQVVPETILRNDYLSGFTSSETDTETYEMIKHFLQVATNNDIDVILVIAPTLYHHYQDGDEYVVIEDQIVSDFTSSVNLYDVPIYDERDLSYDGIVSFEEFQDVGHLNQDGATIFSKRLVDIYLQETAED